MLILSFLVLTTAIDWTTDGVVTLINPVNNSDLFDFNITYNFTGNASTQTQALTNVSLYHDFNGTWVLNQTEFFLVGSPLSSTNQSGVTLTGTVTDSGREQPINITNSTVLLESAVAVTRIGETGVPDHMTVKNEVGTIIGNTSNVNYVELGINDQAIFTFIPPIVLEGGNTTYTIRPHNKTFATVRTAFDAGNTNIQNEFLRWQVIESDRIWGFESVQIGPINSSEQNWSFNNPVPFGRNFNWNVEGCALDGTCGFSTRGNFTLANNLDFTSETFQTEITTGATSNFELNFSSFGKTLNNVFLTYNNTNFTTVIIQNGDNYSMNLDIVSPVVTATTNISFFWSLFYSDGTNIERSPNNQTINTISLDDCSTNTVLVYNYTMLDEELKTPISNSTVDLAINIFDLTQENIIVNFSQRFQHTNPVQVCLANNLTEESYRVYSIAKYSANDTVTGKNYAQEYHNILNGSLTNQTIPTNIDLLDLNIDDSTDFQLTFRDAQAGLAPNILVTVFRQYVQDNDFKVVEAPLTDSDGQTVLHLVRNDAIYNMIMINEGGQVVATFNNLIAFCQDFTIGSCTIRLNAPADVTDLYDYDTDIGVSYTAPVFDNSTGLVSLDFVSLNLSVVTVRLEVTKSGNFGNRTVCDVSLTSVSGTLDCNVSTIVSTDRFLFASFFVNSDLKAMFPIDLEANRTLFGVANGAFFAIIIILIIITALMNDKKAIMVGLGAGWIIVLGLGLVNGSVFGIFASGIWILISIIIVLWKMSRGGNS